MSVIFRCPICKTEREASQSVLGRRVRCADCLNFVEVPDQVGQDDDSVVRLATESEKADVESKPIDVANENSIATASEFQGRTINSDPDNMVDETNPNDDEIDPEADEESTSPRSAFELGAPTDESLAATPAIDPFGAESAHKPRPTGEEPDEHETDLINPTHVQPMIRWKEEPDEYDDETYDPIEFKNDRVEREAEMDMTPMVDVTFLLLIFFMVTASFTLQRSIEQPPQTEDEPSLQVTVEEEDEPDYILVFIDEYNTFQVIYGDHDWECPSEQELIRRLREVLSDPSAGATPTEMLVMGHGDCMHERVVMAMDAGTEVGMASIQVTMTETGP